MPNNIGENCFIVNFKKQGIVENFPSREWCLQGSVGLGLTFFNLEFDIFSDSSGLKKMPALKGTKRM